MFLKKGIQIFALSVSVLFTGCVSSSYSKFYQENLDTAKLAATSDNGLEFLRDGEEPLVIATNDIAKELKKMHSKRYIPLGGSAFNGELESIEAVKTQAKKLKAVAAIYTAKFTNTQTNSGMLLLPQTNYYSGTVNAYNGLNHGMATYNGTSKSTMAMPFSKTQMRYDQDAIFFVRYVKPIKFGAFTNDITREKRIEIGKNGVIVDNIFENTPVYNSDLMIGDIIIEVNNKKVENNMIYAQIIEEFDTSKGFCILKVLRNGEEKIIQIKF